MDPLIERAARGAVDEFERRTRELAAGKSSQFPGAVNPETRVPWSWVWATYGLGRAPRNMADDRLAFQPVWERVLKSRGLLSVLRGKLQARAWCEAHTQSLSSEPHPLWEIRYYALCSQLIEGLRSQRWAVFKRQGGCIWDPLRLYLDGGELFLGFEQENIPRRTLVPDDLGRIPDDAFSRLLSDKVFWHAAYACNGGARLEDLVVRA